MHLGDLTSRLDIPLLLLRKLNSNLEICNN